jgi:hypothetical protein
MSIHIHPHVLRWISGGSAHVTALSIVAVRCFVLLTPLSKQLLFRDQNRQKSNCRKQHAKDGPWICESSGYRCFEYNEAPLTMLVFWIPVLLVLMPGEEHFNYRCLQFRIQLL